MLILEGNKSWASLISMFHTLLQNFSLLIVWILFVVKLSTEATGINWIITFYLWRFFQAFILNCQKDQFIVNSLCLKVLYYLYNLLVLRCDRFLFCLFCFPLVKLLLFRLLSLFDCPLTFFLSLIFDSSFNTILICFDKMFDIFN